MIYVRDLIKVEDLITAGAINTVPTSDGAGALAMEVDGAGGAIETLNFIIDGGGSVITTGIKGDLIVDFAGTIQEVTLLADQTGSIVVDIWKSSAAVFPPTVAHTLTASAKPTIGAAEKSTNNTLVGWTTAITAGDTFRFNVDSIDTIERCTLSLKIARS